MDFNTEFCVAIFRHIQNCFSVTYDMSISKTYSGPCETPKMGHFTKTVTDYKPLTIVAKRSILDFYQGPEYAYAFDHDFEIFQGKLLCEAL